MKAILHSFIPKILVGAGVVTMLFPASIRPEPTAAATAAFDSYVGGVEKRLAKEPAPDTGFLTLADQARLRHGDLIVEELTPEGGKDVGGALVHDWIGSAFATGAKAVDFERMMKDYGAYPQRFSPQVVRSRVITQQGDHYEVTMRVRQQHILTVVMDTSYDVSFARTELRGASRGSSISRSTRVAEIDAPGTAHERALSPQEDHGFLWRMNTYWTWEERDGGLYIRVESVSLTRSVPVGLGWAVKPFIESIPRESLDFTLRAACAAMRR